MKLYAFKPDGHGPLSYFVMAESAAAACEAVTKYLLEHCGKNDGEWIGQAELDDWNSSRHECVELGPGDVVTNGND